MILDVRVNFFSASRKKATSLLRPAIGAFMRVSDRDFVRLSALRTLRRSEPVSRTELAASLGLAHGRISEITSDLVQRGLLIEETVSTKLRGRPRVDLRINPEGSYVLGALLFYDGSLITEVVNLRGDSVSSHRAHVVPNSRILEDLAARMVPVLEASIAASPIKRRAIRQVAIGLPGTVDHRTGILHWLPTFAPGPSEFAAIIADKLQMPVTIDNDTNLLARAEHWFGETDPGDDFTLVALGLGLGSAHYVQGSLSVGAHGMASEFGHVKVAPEGGAPCFCGGIGCLTAYSSISGLVSRLSERLLRARPDLASYVELVPALRAYAGEARGGDKQVQQMFDRAGHYLGLAVANHINTRDPGRVVVLALEQELPELLARRFFEAVDENTLPLLREKTPVDFRIAQANQLWRGAAALGLQQLYGPDSA